MGTRVYRELDDSVKKKIADSNRGKRLSEYTKNLISKKMKAYWDRIEHRPEYNNEEESLEE